MKIKFQLPLRRDKYRCYECGHRSWEWQWPIYRIRPVNPKLVAAMPQIIANARLMREMAGTMSTIKQVHGSAYNEASLNYLVATDDVNQTSPTPSSQ